MRLNANMCCMSRHVTVFLNGSKEGDAVEVYIPGNVLEGRGYVVRGVREKGKSVAAVDVPKPLPTGRYDHEGLLCEKVFGQIRIEIEECKSDFAEDN
jgi:hypothetical protein